MSMLLDDILIQKAFNAIYVSHLSSHSFFDQCQPHQALRITHSDILQIKQKSACQGTC